MPEQREIVFLHKGKTYTAEEIGVGRVAVVYGGFHLPSAASPAIFAAARDALEISECEVIEL